MIFKHEFWPVTNLPKIQTEYGRYYLAPRPYSVLLPSVTTILGRDEVLPDTEAFKRAGTQASHRGNAVHEMCEKYVLNEPIPKAMPFNKASFLSIKKYLDCHLGLVHGVELPLYSMEYLTAGTCDLVAHWDNQLSIIDYKNLKHPLRGNNVPEWNRDKLAKYMAQMGIYAAMVEELYNEHIQQLVLVVAIDHQEPDIIVVDNDPKYLETFVGLRNS